MRWQRVEAVSAESDGRLRLTLACGHTTRINPTLPLGAIRQGLLVSSVPCALCATVHGPEELRRRRGVA